MWKGVDKMKTVAKNLRVMQTDHDLMLKIIKENNLKMFGAYGEAVRLLADKYGVKQNG
jgi:hypothetical protein